MRKLLQAPKGRDLLATIVVSLVLTVAGGAVVTTITAARTEDRVARTERTLCTWLDLSTRPRPRPPQPPADATPQTEFGRALAEYNRQLVAYQARADAVVRKSRADYHC